MSINLSTKSLVLLQSKEKVWKRLEDLRDRMEPVLWEEPEPLYFRYERVILELGYLDSCKDILLNFPQAWTREDMDTLELALELIEDDSIDRISQKHKILVKRWISELNNIYTRKCLLLHRHEKIGRLKIRKLLWLLLLALWCFCFLTLLTPWSFLIFLAITFLLHFAIVFLWNFGLLGGWRNSNYKPKRLWKSIPSSLGYPKKKVDD